MTRVFGPDFVAMQVRDLDAARRFYVEQLGLEVTPQSPPKVGAFLTELIPFAVRESMVDLDEVERLGWGVALWLKCGDANGLCDSLGDGGVPIAQEPFNGPFGRIFSFADPDGYKITVHDG